MSRLCLLRARGFSCCRITVTLDTAAVVGAVLFRLQPVHEAGGFIDALQEVFLHISSCMQSLVIVAFTLYFTKICFLGKWTLDAFSIDLSFVKEVNC